MKGVFSKTIVYSCIITAFLGTAYLLWQRKSLDDYSPKSLREWLAICAGGGDRQCLASLEVLGKNRIKKKILLLKATSENIKYNTELDPGATKFIKYERGIIYSDTLRNGVALDVSGEKHRVTCDKDGKTCIFDGFSSTMIDSFDDGNIYGILKDYYRE